MSRPKQPDEQSGLRPSWLLLHARQLTERVTETDTPRSAHARRAVSAAYYSVFHRVCLDVASGAAGPVERDAWLSLCRCFSHSGVAEVARWLIGGSPPEHVMPLVEVARRSDTLSAFALEFRDLRQERELADYSHRHVFDRRSAQTATDTARTAIDALASVDRDDPEWVAFSILMLLKATPRQRE